MILSDAESRAFAEDGEKYVDYVLTTDDTDNHGPVAIGDLFVQLQKEVKAAGPVINASESLAVNTNFLESITKFRELSNDKILYNCPGHSIELPQTVTITSTLPTPRKGNPGTVKTLVNVRRTIVLGEGTASERNVPVVAKIELSLPLGTSAAERKAIMQQSASALLMSDDDATSLFYTGILPQD